MAKIVGNEITIQSSGGGVYKYDTVNKTWKAWHFGTYIDTIGTIPSWRLLSVKKENIPKEVLTQVGV